MDANERADVLLAQLDCLIALGRLEAARELGRELRELLREAPIGRAPVVSRERRDIVLEPLADLLRRQRALEVELRDHVVLGRHALAEAERKRLHALQAALLQEVVPIRDGPAAGTAALNGLRQGLAATAKGMEDARNALAVSNVQAALAGTEAADDALVAALRWVDKALGSPAPTPLVKESFVSRYLGCRLPDWELPAALGLALHQRMAPLHLPVDLRRELVHVSHYLGENSKADAIVRLRGDERATQRTIEVPLAVPKGARYLILLQVQMSADGPVPATGPVPGTFATRGGSAQVLFAQDLDEARLLVLRLNDRGFGPHLGYRAPADPMAVRVAVQAALRDRFEVVETRPAPVQAEVLRYIDSLAFLEEEGPVSNRDLRVLGIPWYDAADLADRLRPVQERMVFELVESVGEAPDFPGLVWHGDDDLALLALHMGPDGATPTVVFPRELLRHIGWVLSREMQDGERPGLSVLLAALRLNVGLKLTFFDRLVEPGEEEVIERAARALERHYLVSSGVGPDVVADLFSRMTLQHGRAIPPAGEESQTDRRNRQAADLFDARAGEEFVKAGRMPMSALFGAYRQTLVRGLENRGRRRAARSAAFLAEFEDAGLLFANLLRHPETGAGVLIVGDSKLGKSSISARLVVGAPRRGVPAWGFGASDRVLILVPREGPPVAMPSPAHRTFGQWTQELWFRDVDHREIRPPDAVPSADLLPIQSIVFVRRDGAQFRGGGLQPRSVGDLIRDFQHRFGFLANRRFWHRLLGRVSVLDVSLRRRGADTFHEAADAIRSHAAPDSALVGLGQEPLYTEERVDGWFGTRAPPGPVRVTRVGVDGIDIDYFLHADGTVLCRPAQLGRTFELGSQGSFGVEAQRTLIALDPDRLEVQNGRPKYQIAAGRWMPLSAEYYRSTKAGDSFLVPNLPPVVQDSATIAMERHDPVQWTGWLENEE